MLIRTLVISMIVIILSGCTENPPSRDERTLPNVAEDFQALEQKIADCMKCKVSNTYPLISSKTQ